MKILFAVLPGHPLNVPALAFHRLKHALTKGKILRSDDIDIIYLNYEYMTYFGSLLYKALERSGTFHAEGIDIAFRDRANCALVNAGRSELDSYLERMATSEPTYLGKDPARPISQLLQGLEGHTRTILESYSIRDYDIVGLSSTFSPPSSIIKFSRLIKEANRKAITIVGGSLCFRELSRGWLENVYSIDLVASGPSLVSFPQMVNEVLNGKEIGNIHIDGIVHRDSMYQCFTTGADIDVSEPDFTEFSEYSAALAGNLECSTMRSAIPIELSRGCGWGKCSFCNQPEFDDCNTSSCEPNEAMRRIWQALVDNPNSDVMIYDAYVSPQRIADIIIPVMKGNCDQIAIFETRPNIAASVLDMMSNCSGIELFQPGIESFSTSVLRKVNKGTTGFDGILLLRRCLTRDVLPLWNFLCGIPEMTAEEYCFNQETVNRIIHFFPPSGLWPIDFVRWSPYWKSGSALGLVANPRRTLFPNIEANAAAAYSFLASGSTGDSIMELLAEYYETMSKSVNDWRRRWRESEAYGTCPKLDLEQRMGEYIIVDSRYDEEVNIRVSQDDVRALTFLEDIHREKDLAAAMSWGESRANDWIEMADRKGLVFREDGRFTSLVNIQPNGKLHKIYMKNKELRGSLIP